MRNFGDYKPASHPQSVYGCPVTISGLVFTSRMKLDSKGLAGSATQWDYLLRARFLLNIQRINGLVNVLFSSEALQSTAPFRSEGVRGDILRSIVVFLHATFEVILRSCVPNPSKRISVYSASDLNKVLRLVGISAQPFKDLYPPLTQMAKRRKLIVHDADVSTTKDQGVGAWTIVDDWQSIMWLLAVPTFYYQLLISTGVASHLDHDRCKRLRRVMLSHVDFGKKLVNFPKQSRELQLEAVENLSATATDMAAILKT